MNAPCIPGIQEFLRDYPKMVARPAPARAFLLKGRFAFKATSDKAGEITDEYTLEIMIPSGFPDVLPSVTETGRKIPRSGGFHVNSKDGTLCLGSPLRLMAELSKDPTLIGFADRCLVPYLFAISHKLRFHGPLPFNELEHGLPGVIADYADLFRLKSPGQVQYAVRLLGMKKRRANKLPCPCNCGKRLGKCSFNDRLRQFRRIASRRWFRSEAQRFSDNFPPVKPLLGRLSPVAIRGDNS